jgi:hypothetical protein
VVARFDQQLDEQRRRNYDMNDYNLDLLDQTEALEAHMRLLIDQNRLLEDEIDKVIKDDDAIAQTLENRRSISPVKSRH